MRAAYETANSDTTRQVLYLHVDSEVGSGSTGEVHGVGDVQVQLVAGEPELGGIRAVHREGVHLIKSIKVRHEGCG